MKADPVITKAKFRFMLIFFWVFAILSIVIDAFNETYWMIDELLYKEPEVWEATLAVILFVGVIIIYVGLFLFKEWARKLYVYVYFPAFLLYLMPGMGWTYMSNYASMFYDLSLVLSALTLGILLVPSLYQPLFKAKT